MIGSAYKKFDKELFDKNDKLAREAAKNYFMSLGIDAVDNPDKYGPDILLKDGNMVEVEVKHSWKGNEFPFDTLQLPTRKEKFAKLGCIFLVFNTDLSCFLKIKSSDILTSPTKEVSNKFVSKGEKFYQVDIDKCELFSLT